ncbi:MAG: ribonuclease D, partial [Candidatus Limnocylindria bacterium]
MPPRWAQQPAHLERAVREAGAHVELALDTEGDSLHHYPERLSLVQLGLPSGEVWLVDPLALPDLSLLAPLFADPAHTLVLHAGDNDLSHLKRRYGFSFASIFDTSIAARFLGGTSLGLDVLLTTHLGVTLPPSRQKDD